MNLSNKPQLVIGNKNYSTWSLRAWLALHAFGIEFEEIQIELFSDSAKPILQQYSPTGKVPAYKDANSMVWDSLAIAGFLANKFKDKNMWGNHPDICHSLVAEMHSGFLALRNEMPMNIRAKRQIMPSQACLNDINRVEQIFNKYRKEFVNEGDYLLGSLSLADVFFAPLAFRFKTYNHYSDIQLNQISQTYINTLLTHPSMQLWQQQALTETSVIKHDETGMDVQNV
ncbi:glutathione S-transferase family protein [Psychrobacter sp. HD31]|uniref:glutathione S-transferase family protein n=1 Tax=Psychrobacter sp. HD31 TaxID=3112003 RepID=UPI003DA430A4